MRLGLARLITRRQVAYYIADTPLTLYKMDKEQLVHHTIGFGLLLPPLLCGRCAVSNLGGQLSLQVSLDISETDVGEDISGCPMLLNGLECPVSKLVNGDTCPRPTTQGSTIFVRLTKFQRFFLPKYNRLEHALVVVNYVQTWASLAAGSGAIFARPLVFAVYG